jgi:hypothetical protein
MPDSAWNNSRANVTVSISSKSANTIGAVYKIDTKMTMTR